MGCRHLQKCATIVGQNVKENAEVEDGGEEKDEQAGDTIESLLSVISLDQRNGRASLAV